MAMKNGRYKIKGEVKTHGIKAAIYETNEYFQTVT